jgi:putative ABC transport system permease protein
MKFIYIKVAFKNIFRNKRRTFLTLTTIGITVLIFVAALGWVDGVMNMWVDNTVRFSSGHVKLIHEKYLKKEKLLPIHFAVHNLSEVVDIVDDIDGVEVVNPRIRFGGQVEHEGRTVDSLCLAVDPLKEKKVTRMMKFIKYGSYWGKDEENQDGIIIGVGMAEELGVKVGDEVSILTRTVNFSPYLLVYKVRAIYHSRIGTLDKNMLYITLRDAEDLLNLPNAANEVLIMIKDSEKSYEVASIIEKNLEEAGLKNSIVALPWQEQKGMGKMLRLTDSVMLIILIIISVVAGLTILNTMLMSVFERSHEIGMIRALGMKKSSVMYLVIAEALVLAFFASFIGGGIGASVSYFYLEKVGIDIGSEMDILSGWYFDPVMKSNFEFIQYFYGFMFGFLLAGLSAIYPAARAATMRPVEALRVI